MRDLELARVLIGYKACALLLLIFYSVDSHYSS
jgi:hypothetical protein